MGEYFNKYRLEPQKGETPRTIEINHAEIMALNKMIMFLKFECSDPEAGLYAGSTSLNSLLGKVLEVYPYRESQQDFLMKPNPRIAGIVMDQLERADLIERTSSARRSPELNRLIMEAMVYPYAYDEQLMQRESYPPLLPEDEVQTGEQWTEQLAGIMYKEPHAEQIRSSWDRLSLGIRNLLLLIDYDTELQMNGLLTALHNFDARHQLDQLITALQDAGLVHEAILVQDLQQLRSTEEDIDAAGNLTRVFAAKLQIAEQIIQSDEHSFLYDRMYDYADCVLQSWS
ncbi:hypothetical protein [Paenibacillus bovis]|uniref:Uncharacterized protein n=1 Tax=Paenibacillus bovis TaxID=1616788 RepID=A0A172ZFK3_9BACL|nr:hypothetical protein [Paenibacillus bovis]ANF96388.1 hypothetical protein AR543_10480 [Paenibacillus bovis]